jgi:arsenate reductase (thioredoxin)
MLFPKILETLHQAKNLPVEQSRVPVLSEVEDYISQKLEQGLPINLNFICTHNSRRSQLSQVWAQAIAYHLDLPVHAFSGGVEVTGCNSRTISSLRRSGFEIAEAGGDNPMYEVHFALEKAPLKVFSKLYDDNCNPTKDFAAIMTCSEADENCPFIPGAERRIALRYEDPKKYDDTELEQQAYDQRSLQIATELYHILSYSKSKS